MSSSKRRSSKSGPPAKRPRLHDTFLEGPRFQLILSSPSLQGVCEGVVGRGGGTLVYSGATHVVTDMNMERMLKHKRARGVEFNDDVIFLSKKWLSECAKQKRLVEVEDWLVDGAGAAPAAAAPLSPAGDPKVKDLPYRIHRKSAATSPISGHGSPGNSNTNITECFARIAVLCKGTKDANDVHRVRAYEQAVRTLSQWPSKIRSSRDLKNTRMGPSILRKVDEILSTGRCSKLDELERRDDVKAVALFQTIYGVGPSTANKIYGAGCRTLDDLRRAVAEGKYTLDNQQEIGLALHYDLTQRIPREEVILISDVVRTCVEECIPGAEMTTCGSFRRGQATCGDVDVLVVHPDMDSDEIKAFMVPLLDRLRAAGLLTHDLDVDISGSHRWGKNPEEGYGAGGQAKYMGVCKLPGYLHRRIDIILAPWRERACALAYFTGSKELSKQMRVAALKAEPKLRLNQHGLWYHDNRTTPIPTETEDELFLALGYPPLKPEERNF